MNRKTGILHIFNSILQNKICFPLKPIRGRKKEYTAPKSIIIPNTSNPIDRSSKFSAIYIPNRKYGAINIIIIGIFFMLFSAPQSDLCCTSFAYQYSTDFHDKGNLLFAKTKLPPNGTTGGCGISRSDSKNIFGGDKRDRTIDRLSALQALWRYSVAVRCLW